MSKFSLPRANGEFILSEENATSCLMELVGYYAIDIDGIEKKDLQDTVEDTANKLLQYYRLGLIENKRDKGQFEIVHHLKHPIGEVTELVYAEMTARAKRATDGFDQNDRYARAFAMMEYLSGSPKGTIDRLRGVDLAIVENLSLFLLLGAG